MIVLIRLLSDVASSCNFFGYWLKDPSVISARD